MSDSKVVTPSDHLAEIVRAGCSSADVHLMCSYPKCSCRQMPNAIKAALRTEAKQKPSEAMRKAVWHSCADEDAPDNYRAMRDANWSNISGLSVGVPYRMYFTGKAWQATTTARLIDGVFDRTIVSSSVYRDANSDIAVSGTLDAGTKKLEVTVSWWNGKATSSKNVILYRLFKLLGWCRIGEPAA